MGLEAAGHGEDGGAHSSTQGGKVGTLREWLQCVSILICKGQIITELAILKPETVSLGGGGGMERGRAGIKSPSFKEKKQKGREPEKCAAIHF